MRRSRRSLLVAIGASIAVAGCIGNGEDPGDDEGMDANDDAGRNDEGEEQDGGVEKELEKETVIVGPDGNHRFDPETLEIDPGTTVEFVWEDSGHNIAVTEQPDGSDWEGAPGLEDEGHTHEHTFDVDGQYEYICEPHATGGMEGTLLVGNGEDVDDGKEDDDRGLGGY